MSFAPQHDWSYLDELMHDGDTDRLREMTTAERFAVYADMYNSHWKARQSASGDWDRLDAWRWQEKLAMRRRMVEAFSKLDQMHCG